MPAPKISRRQIDAMSAADLKAFIQSDQYDRQSHVIKRYASKRNIALPQLAKIAAFNAALAAVPKQPNLPLVVR